MPNRKQLLTDMQREMHDRQTTEREMEIQQSDVCICGRLTVKLHCPECGSQVIYGITSKTSQRVDPQTNEVRQFRMFRCRRCAKIFDEVDWKYNCHAPDLKRSVPHHDARQEQEKTVLMSTEAQKALEIIRKRRGLD